MINQYYEKPVSRWNGKNIWNWVTGTGLNHEQRVRIYGPQSTQTTNSNPGSSQKRRRRDTKKSSHSSVNNSKEHKSSTTNSKNVSSQKGRREPPVNSSHLSVNNLAKSKSLSLFGSTEEIRPSVEKSFQENSSTSPQSNQSEENNVSNSRASKSTKLIPSPKDKKSSKKTLDVAKSKSSSLFGSTEEIRSSVSPQSKNKVSNSSASKSTKLIPTPKDKKASKKTRDVSKINKIRKKLKMVKSSSSYTRKHLSRSSQSNSSPRWCSGEKICAVIIIIGCCGIAAVSYHVYLERGKLVNNSGALEIGKDQNNENAEKEVLMGFSHSETMKNLSSVKVKAGEEFIPFRLRNDQYEGTLGNNDLPDIHLVQKNGKEYVLVMDVVTILWSTEVTPNDWKKKDSLMMITLHPINCASDNVKITEIQFTKPDESIE